MKPAAEFEILLDGAIEVADEHYRHALAEQLRGNYAGKLWRAFEIAYARAQLLANLLGVAAVTEPMPTPKQFARRVPFDPETIDLAEDFLVGDFVEAIELFEGRIPDLPEVVRALQSDALSAANAVRRAEEGEALGLLAKQSEAIREAIGRRFWVSGIPEVGIVNLRNLIADAIEGTASEEMLGLVPFINKAQAQGAEGLSRARLETVYRNNLNTAFMDGQVQALRAPETLALIPLVMLEEIRDGRSRGRPNDPDPNPRPHFQMHGYVNTMDYFERAGIVPPNGHNCRGGMRPVSNAEARRKGWMREDGTIDEQALARYNGRRQGFIDSGAYPDPGFNIRRTPQIAA